MWGVLVANKHLEQHLNTNHSFFLSKLQMLQNQFGSHTHIHHAATVVKAAGNNSLSVLYLYGLFGWEFCGVPVKRATISFLLGFFWPPSAFISTSNTFILVLQNSCPYLTPDKEILFLHPTMDEPSQLKPYTIIMSQNMKLAIIHFQGQLWNTKAKLSK